MVRSSRGRVPQRGGAPPGAGRDRGWRPAGAARPPACTDYPAGTFTDWRLPNAKELLSLIDFGESFPALPSSNPFSMVQADYWSASSDTFIAVNQDAWVVDFASGIVKHVSKASSSMRAWENSNRNPLFSRNARG